MKLHLPLSVRTHNNQMYLSGYTEAEPKELDYTVNNGMYWSQWKQDHNKWQQSKVEYAVCEESVKLFHSEFICEDFKNLEQNYPVNVDSLSDRIEIVEVPIVKEKGRLYPAINQYRKVARLKPQEESINDLWNDLFDVWTEASMDDSKVPVIEVLKQKFTIKRNQNG